MTRIGRDALALQLALDRTNALEPEVSHNDCLAERHPGDREGGEYRSAIAPQRGKSVVDRRSVGYDPIDRVNVSYFPSTVDDRNGVNI
jgi:hypothetical protein